VLFPMADRMLGELGQRELLHGFERVEHHDLGSGTHERYVELARSLCERLGTSGRRTPRARTRVAAPRAQATDPGESGRRERDRVARSLRGVLRLAGTPAAPW